MHSLMLSLMFKRMLSQKLHLLSHLKRRLRKRLLRPGSLSLEQSTLGKQPWLLHLQADNFSGAFAMQTPEWQLH